MLSRKRQEEKVLDVNASMQGTLVFKEPVNLKINGQYDGTLEVRGNLTVGPQAAVNATINGDTIVIAGKVNGDIEAKVRLVLLPTAQVLGNIKIAQLVIEEGAVFEGKCNMLEAPKHLVLDSNKDVLSVDEVAQFLEVESSIVTDWATNGKIPALKEGHSWKFQRDKIEEWLASERTK